MKQVKESRLGFIDAGRSLAIILMLQGHFISLTFRDYTTMRETLIQEGTSGSLLFDFWVQFRGFTAPLFFTITGLVFAYLLTRDPDGDFWKIKRVRKGIRRGFMIILWGYALQLSFDNLELYLSGQLNDRFFTFHVLHSIGFGILLLILLYGIQRWIKHIHYSVLLLIIGIAIFVFTPMIHARNLAYFPAGAHQLIQNMFHGPNSVFPIFPWFGFVCLGGALGALIMRYKERFNETWFPLIFVTVTATIALVLSGIIYFIELNWQTNYILAKAYWPFIQLAGIIGLLGALIYICRITWLKSPFLIAMGQNTLVIYIVHVIILYGAILGFGIRTWYDKSLSFNASFGFALLFILFFGILTYVQDKIQLRRKSQATDSKQVQPN